MVIQIKKITKTFQAIVIALVFVMSSVLTLSLASPQQASAQSSDTMPCTNQVYLSQSDEVSFASTLYKLDLTQDPFQLDMITSPTDDFWNAVGYRFDDGYFYATTPDDAAGAPGEIFRINSSGESSSLGELLPTDDGTRFFAGDVRSSPHIGGDGYYYVLNMDDSNASDNDTNEFFVVDVSGVTATLVDTVSITGVTDVRLNDWAFNPVDGQLYGFEQHRNRLITINPDTGAAELIGSSQPELGDVHGAAWFDADGKFFSYNNGLSEDYGNLYRINTATGAATEINPGGAPSVARNDGAGCPFAPLITKVANPENVVQGGTTTYTYTVTNAMQETELVADFEDILENGRTYVAGSLDNSEIGGTPNSYAGTDTLRISGATVPDGATVSFSIKVKIPLNIEAPGTYYNQGCLDDFEISTFGRICSDYPITTDIIGDPTPIYVEPIGAPDSGLPFIAKHPLVVAALIIGPAIGIALIARKYREKTT